MSGLLTALEKTTNTKEFSFQISNETGYNTDWRCPVCGAPMYYQKRSVDGRIAHFCHKTAADHASLSEGQLHSQMKQQLYELYRDSDRVTTTDLEHPVGGEYFEHPERIADISVELSDGTSVAIEIQCSPQSTDAFEQRTAAYNRHGIHVLWLVQEEAYLPSKTSRDGSITGVAYKDAVKWLQRHYYGRAYTFSQDSVTVADPARLITPTRVQSVSTVKSGYDQYGDYREYRYTYKTLGEKTIGALPNLDLLATKSQGKKIARFYDPCWWKGDPR